MNTNNILKADLLDIIFDNRNKNYGAYPLRKYYHERVLKALAITFFLAAIISLIVFFHKTAMFSTVIFQDTEYGKIPETPREQPSKQEQPQKPKLPAPRPKITAPVIFQAPVITDNKIADSKIFSITDSAELSLTDDGVKGTGIAAIADPGPGSSFPGKDISPPADKTIALNSAEIMPSYPGGTAALLKFLKKNLVTPNNAEPGETVVVKIKFVVGYDGVLKGFETMEDGGTVFNNEVIRVLKKMPAWIPGRSRGENVSVFYTIPVVFTSGD